MRFPEIQIQCRIPAGSIVVAPAYGEKMAMGICAVAVILTDQGFGIAATPIS